MPISNDISINNPYKNLLTFLRIIATVKLNFITELSFFKQKTKALPPLEGLLQTLFTQLFLKILEAYL